jgi:hypothetical protein
MKRKDKKKQKGGDMSDPTYDSGGTSGNVGTLVEDIWGTVVYTVGSITSAILTITDTMTLGPDIGSALSNPATPNPDNVDIPQLN